MIYKIETISIPIMYYTIKFSGCMKELRATKRYMLAHLSVIPYPVTDHVEHIVCAVCAHASEYNVSNPRIHLISRVCVCVCVS